MNEPKFAVGQSVYISPVVVNATFQIIDRYWDPDLKPAPGFRYKFASSPNWYPEFSLMTPEELAESLAEEEDPLEHDYYSYEYDADTGKVFKDGRWILVTPSQWERYQQS